MSRETATKAHNYYSLVLRSGLCGTMDPKYFSMVLSLEKLASLWLTIRYPPRSIGTESYPKFSLFPSSCPVLYWGDSIHLVIATFPIAWLRRVALMPLLEGITNKVLIISIWTGQFLITSLSALKYVVRSVSC
ncbi:hypothetical protein BKA64DRAFT_71124 [Cadophora sp. MPI-SDFR-AT-0126]|nr:hypothetical protein BKA64DRAFT_71124 [Leotiomycetes sp. MPI-SDFR-AT-0126]